MPISRRFSTFSLDPMPKTVLTPFRRCQCASPVKRVVGLLAVCSLAVSPSVQLAAMDLAKWNAQVVAGWVEPIYLGEANIKLTAKLDTGANTSSLSAADLTHLVRQQKPWVAFTVRSDDGQEIRIEQPVIRIARIRRAGAGVRERPVISLPVCLAGYREPAEFTLTDRSAMNYPVLIGRAFLAKRIIVDSQATFATTQSCLAGK